MTPPETTPPKPPRRDATFPHVPDRTWRHLRLAALAAISGVLIGLASFLFLEALDWATRTRIAHDGLVWLLPLAGLATGLGYHAFGGRSGEGTGLLLKEIHEPSAWVPRRMAPMVGVAAVVSHTFGASVGREGTALQMSGSLTDLVGRAFRVRREDRRVLLIAALGGGFAAVFGVAWAGLVFGIEVQWIRRLRGRGLIRWVRDLLPRGDRAASVDLDVDDMPPQPDDDLADRTFEGTTRDAPNARLLAAVIPTAVAAFIGNGVVRLLGYHERRPAPFRAPVDLGLVGRAALIGLAAGLCALVFVSLTERIRHGTTRFVAWPPARPLLGGVVIVALGLVAGHEFLGLSHHLAEAALAGDSTTYGDTGWKLLFTAICLGTGFIGGEVTPMFVLGATLGGATGHLLGIDPAAGAALGYTAVFAGAANAPVACTVLAVEVFGTAIAAPAAAACVAAFVASGRWGVFHHRPDDEPSLTGRALLLAPGLDPRQLARRRER